MPPRFGFAPRRRPARLWGLALAAAALAGPLAADPPIYHSGWIDYDKNGREDPFEDPRLPVDQRLDDLWSRMTFAEKLAQIRSAAGAANLDPANLPAVGTVTQAARDMTLAEACAKLTALQRSQIEGTRLGIPLLFVDEGLHGLRAPEATSFPQSIALAATWDPGLMGRVAGAIAEELKARGVRQALSPVVDIGRDSRWGRTEETYGEDPYLVSRMAVAFSGALESRGVIATPKHFVADSGDGGRDSAAQFLGERLLDDIYFPPYLACIREAGIHCIMPAYDALDGLPVVAQPRLLTGIARQEWGFRGYFGSDFGAVRGVQDRHLLTDDPAEVAALCLNAGLDVEWPQSDYYGRPLDEALARGLVSRTTVEASARRVLRAKFEIGLFDSPLPDLERARELTDSPAHRALAREAAGETLVLLKNEDGVLPLDPARLRTVAVIGRNAETAQLGDYSGTGIRTVSILEGLRAALPGVDVKYCPGVTSSPTPFIAVPGEAMDGGRGFQYDYYADPAGAGPPIATGRAMTVALPPGPKGPRYGFARWTGTFVPETDLHVRLAVRSTGKVRVRIDGREILDNLGTAGRPDRPYDPNLGRLPTTVDFGPPEFLADFDFQRGRPYAVEIACRAPDSGLSFEWDQRIYRSREIRAAVALAARADAVVVVPGGLVEGEAHDRPILGYPPEEGDLIRAVAGTGKPVVAVLVNGAAVTVGDWEPQVSAILEAWYDGEEQGSAVAEALLGRLDPGGRLPLTFPQYSGQEPLCYDHYPLGRPNGFHDPFRGQPQYPFGYGLSYTSFGYANLRLSRAALRPGETVQVAFDVTNRGPRLGDEVAQLYLHDRTASVVRPVLQLRGFARLRLAPGETRTATLALGPDDLSFRDRDGRWVMEPREVDVLVGASAEDIRLAGRLAIER